MNKKSFFKKIILPAAAVFAMLQSCNSVPEEISEDLDARQLIQLGQDNYDNANYKAAELYFEAVLERFGDDAKHYVESKYELGHLYMKQKKYEEAYKNFNEILQIYDQIPAGLPGAYKKLCEIELKKIPEKTIAQIQEKEAAREADLTAEAEKVKAEEAERAAKENKNVKDAKPLPLELEDEPSKNDATNAEGENQNSGEQEE